MWKPEPHFRIDMNALRATGHTAKQTPPVSLVGVEWAMNLIIARAICPKRKGWAWKKGSTPVDFAEPCQTNALITWANAQPWWNDRAPVSYGEDQTWLTLFQDMSADFAEGRLDAKQYATSVRGLIAEAIRATEAAHHGLERTASGEHAQVTP